MPGLLGPSERCGPCLPSCVWRRVELRQEHFLSGSASGDLQALGSESSVRGTRAQVTGVVPEELLSRRHVIIRRGSCTHHGGAQTGGAHHGIGVWKETRERVTCFQLCVLGNVVREDGSTCLRHRYTWAGFLSLQVVVCDKNVWRLLCVSLDLKNAHC